MPFKKKPGGRRVMTAAYLEPRQKAALDALSRATGVPATAYVREGVDLVLARHRRGRKRGAR